MDKQSLVIFAFLVVSVLFAAILAMGAVPKIFQTSDKMDQALLQQHEDASRANQTANISNHIHIELEELKSNLTGFIDDSSNRSAYGAAERQYILESILEVSNQHDKVAADHARIQKEVGNITMEIRDMLRDYGENSVEKLQSIVDTQKFIVDTHEKILAKLDNNTSTR
jgi:hypothetical protein